MPQVRSVKSKEILTMRLLEKKMIYPHQGAACVAPARMLTYIDRNRPILLDRFAWESKSDFFEDYHDTVSRDNGKTWSKPEPRLKSEESANGLWRYGSQTAFLDPDTNRVILFSSRAFYPREENDHNNAKWVTDILFYDPEKERWSEPVRETFGLKEGLFTSFSFPLKTRRGRLIFPAQKPVVNARGEYVHYHPDSYSRAYQALVILGDYRADGSVSWRLSEAVSGTPGETSRGLCEPTVLELNDGRLVMVCRGDNAAIPDKPGYKWVAFSSDEGETWSCPTPFGYADGELFESASNGSALFRSAKDGKVYWIGNLLGQGQRAQGNFPRRPLVIAEVDETRFALKRETVFVIDQRQPGEPDVVQLSNFVFYQDRETGDLVLSLTRLGECDAAKWTLADCYRYRVSMP